MNAPEIAGAGDVPNDDRPTLAGVCRGTGTATVAQAVGGLFVSGPEAREIDHGGFELVGKRG